MMYKPILQACICSICNQNLTEFSELRRNEHLNECRNKNKENIPHIHNIPKISTSFSNKFTKREPTSNSSDTFYIFEKSKINETDVMSYQGNTSKCQDLEIDEDSEIEIIEDLSSQTSNFVMNDNDDKRKIEINKLYESKKLQLKEEYEKKKMEIESQYKLSLEKLDEERQEKLKELDNNLSLTEKKRKHPLKEHIPTSKKVCTITENVTCNYVKETDYSLNSKIQNFNILDCFSISTNNVHNNEILNPCDNSEEDLLVPALNIKSSYKPNKTNNILINKNNTSDSNRNNKDVKNNTHIDVSNVQTVTYKDFEKYSVDELKVMAKRYGLKYKSKKFVIEQLVAIKNYENENNLNQNKENPVLRNNNIEDTQIANSISEFIKSNKYLYNKILHYEAISVEETQRLLKENDIKISKVKLRSYLKLQGINYIK